MKKKKFLTFITAACAVGLCMQISVSGMQPPEGSDDFYTGGFDWYDPDLSYDELNNYILGEGYSFIDDGYDVLITASDSVTVGKAWDMRYRENLGGYGIYFGHDYDLKIKIPDSFKFKGTRQKKEVKSVDGSCGLKEFDLNPENKYMTLVDNVVFSKDKKTLMSYAQYDERTYYEVPDGTEIIGYDAFDYCNNIKEIYMPDTVKEINNSSFSSMDNLEKINIPPLVEEIRDATFSSCDNLKNVYIPEDSKLKKIDSKSFWHTKICELTLPSFDVEICDYAFYGDYGYDAVNVALKSYVKPELKSEYRAGEKAHMLQWNEIPNASYYEIYQNLGNGEYKNLGKTTSTSHCFKNLKPGCEYTFAVKPVAKIKPFKGTYSENYHDLPEYFIIEGTMSEDISVIG